MRSITCVLNVYAEVGIKHDNNYSAGITSHIRIGQSLFLANIIMLIYIVVEPIGINLLQSNINEFQHLNVFLLFILILLKMCTISLLIVLYTYRESNQEFP